MSKNDAEYFEKMLKRDFDAGGKSRLLFAIYASLDLGRPIPEWARIAFLRAYEAAEDFEIRSWDEVFGRPVPKGTHLKSTKRDVVLPLIIVEHVEALRAAGRKVNKGDLFKEVGKKWGISATRASEIYYANRSRRDKSVAGLLLRDLNR